MTNPVLEELQSEIQGSDELVAALEVRDAGQRLITLLPKLYGDGRIKESSSFRAWELCGVQLMNSNRIYEALGVFWELYQHMLRAQTDAKRIHKGMPLCWIGECFTRLDFPVHAKRYLMLTWCEDAISQRGSVSPETTGAYFRLAWGYGLPDEELRRYATRFFDLSEEMPTEAIFPEALLQRADDAWLTELPSGREASAYRINPQYPHHLLAQLGGGTGEALELLSEYLMSCMPGCRTRRRQKTPSTDYDIVCGMEGFQVDFRSELGRYFVCECKDWQSPADFTVMAKFCRVLDSTKSRFGILFSKNGITGAGDSEFAEREQLKVFHDRGIVIVVLDLSELEQVAAGANLTALLRQKYETVRLDVQGL
jgi:hypothetical protein